MARFVLLWVPNNKTVDPLIEKLSVSKAVKVVGVFAEPTSFCDKTCGRQDTQAWRKYNNILIHPKWGTRHCPLCKKVIKTWGFRLSNGLDPENLPGKMKMLSLWLGPTPEGDDYAGRSVWEIFGKKAVKAAIAEQVRTKAVVDNYRANADKRRQARANRRSRRNR